MNNNSLTTNQAILNAGKREFLKNGFRAASLRNIVKEAGVTTGAFYGYYKSKEDLFGALVCEPAEALLFRFKDSLKRFEMLPVSEQMEQMGKISGDCMDWIVEYIYDHTDAFKLILCDAEGTEYENFIDTIVRIETDATHRFISALNRLGHQVKMIDSKLEHILISGMFSAFFELVIHDMPKSQAVGYVKNLRSFYTAGWKEIMGL